MAGRKFSCLRRGPDGYPPYVRGLFCMAREGTMQRGYRDVGYLLSRWLRHFRPATVGARAWQYHIDTLRQTLALTDQRMAEHWLAVTYPGLAALIPAQPRDEFIAGMRETRCEA